MRSQYETFFLNMKEIREECKQRNTCINCPFREERVSRFESECIVQNQFDNIPEKWDFRKLHSRMLRMRAQGKKKISANNPIIPCPEFTDGLEWCHLGFPEINCGAKPCSLTRDTIELK